MLGVIVIGPVNGTVTEGQSVTLECRVNSDEEAPYLQWRYMRASAFCMHDNVELYPLKYNYYFSDAN